MKKGNNKPSTGEEKIPVFMERVAAVSRELTSRYFGRGINRTLIIIAAEVVERDAEKGLDKINFSFVATGDPDNQLKTMLAFYGEPHGKVLIDNLVEQISQQLLAEKINTELDEIEAGSESKQ